MEVGKKGTSFCFLRKKTVAQRIVRLQPLFSPSLSPLSLRSHLDVDCNRQRRTRLSAFLFSELRFGEEGYERNQLVQRPIRMQTLDAHPSLVSFLSLLSLGFLFHPPRKKLGDIVQIQLVRFGREAAQHRQTMDCGFASKLFPGADHRPQRVLFAFQRAQKRRIDETGLGGCVPSVFRDLHSHLGRVRARHHSRKQEHENDARAALVARKRAAEAPRPGFQTRRVADWDVGIGDVHSRVVLSQRTVQHGTVVIGDQVVKRTSCVMSTHLPLSLSLFPLLPLLSFSPLYRSLLLVFRSVQSQSPSFTDRLFGSPICRPSFPPVSLPLFFLPVFFSSHSFFSVA